MGKETSEQSSPSAQQTLGAAEEKKEQGKETGQGQDRYKTDKPRDDIKRDTKRLPAVDRQIADIKPEDIRVRITGMVIDRQGSRIVLDDGTGKAEVAFEGDVGSGSDFVRVLGRIMPVDGGFEIQGEALQDMSGVDRKLLARVRELEQKTFNTGN